MSAGAVTVQPVSETPVPSTCCEHNPLVRPLLNFNGYIVSEFGYNVSEQNDKKCACWELIKKIALTIIAPFTYLILGLTALVGISLNCFFATRTIQPLEEHPLQRIEIPPQQRVEQEEEIHSPTETNNSTVIDLNRLSEDQLQAIDMNTVSEQAINDYFRERHENDWMVSDGEFMFRIGRFTPVQITAMQDKLNEYNLARLIRLASEDHVRALKADNLSQSVIDAAINNYIHPHGFNDRWQTLQKFTPEQIALIRDKLSDSTLTSGLKHNGEEYIRAFHVEEFTQSAVDEAINNSPCKEMILRKLTPPEIQAIQRKLSDPTLAVLIIGLPQEYVRVLDNVGEFSQELVNQILNLDSGWDLRTSTLEKFRPDQIAAMQSKLSTETLSEVVRDLPQEYTRALKVEEFTPQQFVVIKTLVREYRDKFSPEQIASIGRV